MGFFKNRMFNLIYVHGALQSVAATGGEAFQFVFLLKAGIPAPIVLLAVGVMFGSRIFVRGLVLPLAKQFGLRNALIIGIVLEGISFPILSQVNSVGPLMYFHLALVAVSSSLYWTSYHAFVALIGDNEHRGSQVGALEFIGTFVGIIAPIMMGLMLTIFSPLFAFSVIGAAMVGSAIPLLFTPNLQIKPAAEVPPETTRNARLLLFTDGLRSGSFHFTWLIAMFITLGSSFAAYGGALSLAGLAGAVMGLLLGKSIDLGKGKRAAKIGFSVLGVAIVARIVGYPYLWSALVANALATIAWPIYITAFNSRIYQLAKQSPCPLRYHVVAESGWDLGVALSCSISAALIYLGFSYYLPLSVALIGCALGYWVLRNTFNQATQ